jgi:hypothetical protein
MKLFAKWGGGSILQKSIIFSFIFKHIFEFQMKNEIENEHKNEWKMATVNDPNEEHTLLDAKFFSAHTTHATAITSQGDRSLRNRLRWAQEFDTEVS